MTARTAVVLLAAACLLVFAMVAGASAQTAQTVVAPGVPVVSAPYTLGVAARTSAGVYRDRTLIKTLWSNVERAAGQHTAGWDGTTDSGTIAPSGAYSIRVVSNTSTYTWEGVIGNTSTANSGPTKWHAEDIAYGMAIAGNTMYVATGYNEARVSTFKADLANPQAKTTILPKRFRYTGAKTTHVATDGTLVYWAGSDFAPPYSHFIYASRTSDDTEVEFAAGKALAVANGGGAKYKSVIGSVDDAKAGVTGLAVQKAGRFLFAARREFDRIDVIDKSTGALVRSVPGARPGALAIDRRDQLWVALEEAGKPRVAKFTVSADGGLTPIAGLELTRLTRPLALAVSPDDRVLLVADGGGSQQVKAYANDTAEPRWSFGTLGGYATGPAVTDDKFYFRNHNHITFTKGIDWTYLAFQPDGSFWVGDSGNDRSQHYGADRTFLGRIMWIPVFYSQYIDPNDPTRVFANLLEFKVDYSKPLQPGNGSWTLVRNWAHGFPADYDDIYSRMRSVTTLSNGRTYAQMRSLSKGKFQIVELTKSGLRFTGVEMPDLQQVLYRDGTLRITPLPQAGKPMIWARRDLAGFDAAGNPQWGPLVPVTTAPAPGRLDPAPYPNSIPGAWQTTASGTLVSFNTRNPRKEYSSDAVSHAGWHLGGLDPATGAWLWKAAPSTHAGYFGPFPDDGAFEIGNYIVAGASRAHVLDRSIFWQYFGEGWGGGVAGETNMWTHVHETGLVLGQFGAVQRTIDYEEDEGQIGMAGNASANSVIRAPNGVVYVHHNDEGFHGGIHRWRIDGLDSIAETVVPVVWAAERYKPATPDPGDLLQGLPRNSVVAPNVAGWRRMPATDITGNAYLDWWQVITSKRSYKSTQPPDIEITHVGTGEATVERVLPTPSGSLANWSVSGTVSWVIENHEEAGRGGGMYLDVVDTAGRVIARILPKRIKHPSDYRVLGNGEPLLKASDAASFLAAITRPTAFTIRAADGRVSIAYGSGPAVTAAAVDPAARVDLPALVRVYCWSTAGSRYRRTLNFRELRFAAGRG